MDVVDHRYARGPFERRSGSGLVLTAVLLSAMVTGCGGSGASIPAGASPGSGGSPGAAGFSSQPASPLAPDGAAVETYTGRLGLDSIEGGCPYLETSERRRYEVIYPAGWTLRKAPLELVAPDGQVVARVGDEVTVRGFEADMVSICQIGPIIQATEVVAGG